MPAREMPLLENLSRLPKISEASYIQGSDPRLAAHRALLAPYDRAEFTVLCLCFLKKGQISSELRSKSTLFLLGLFGAVTATSVIPQAHAYNLAIVPYVISMKRSGIILSTIAGVVYFRETENIITRICGFLLAMGGATVITLFGIS